MPQSSLSLVSWEPEKPTAPEAPSQPLTLVSWEPEGGIAPARAISPGASERQPSIPALDDSGMTPAVAASWRRVSAQYPDLVRGVKAIRTNPALQAAGLDGQVVGDPRDGIIEINPREMTPVELDQTLLHELDHVNGGDEARAKRASRPAPIAARGFTQPESVRVTEPPPAPVTSLAKDEFGVETPTFPVRPGPVGRILTLPVEGAMQIAQGAAEVAANAQALPQEGRTYFNPKTGEGRHVSAVGTVEHERAVNDLIEGTFKAATPLIVAGAITNPVATGAALVKAVIASKLGEKAAEAVGASPEGQRLVGNVAALLSGTVSADKIVTKMRADYRGVIAQARAFDAAHPEPPPVEPKPVGRGATPAAVAEKPQIVETNVPLPPSPEPPAPLPSEALKIALRDLANAEEGSGQAATARAALKGAGWSEERITAEVASQRASATPAPLTVVTFEPAPTTPPPTPAVTREDRNAQALAEQERELAAGTDVVGTRAIEEIDRRQRAGVSPTGVERRAEPPVSVTTFEPESVEQRLPSVDVAPSTISSATSGQSAFSGAKDLRNATDDVESRVPARSFDREVVVSIVRAIPVSVVDNLGGEERATDLLLHDQPMSADSLPATARVDVTRLITAARDVVAAKRAELSGLGPGGRNAEYDAALEALDSHLRIAMARSTSPKTSAVVPSRDVLPVTASGTETAVSGSNLAGKRQELPSTELARQSDLHGGSLPPTKDGTIHEIPLTGTAGIAAEPAAGMTRMYRGEPVGEQPAEAGRTHAYGRWFTASLEQARRYAGDGGTVRYVDLPTDYIEENRLPGDVDPAMALSAEDVTRARPLPGVSGLAYGAKAVTPLEQIAPEAGPLRANDHIEWFQGPRRLRRTGRVLDVLQSGALKVQVDGAAAGQTKTVNLSASPKRLPTSDDRSGVDTTVRERDVDLFTRDLEALRDGEDPNKPQFARTDEGRIRAGIGDEGAAARIMASSLYSKNIAEVATKELLQNAFDAVRERGDDGTVTVRFVRASPGVLPSVEVHDSGKGMTRGELETVFTNLFESGKREESGAAGGFGIAKASFLLGGKEVQVDTVVRQGGKIRYSFTATPEELTSKSGVHIIETAVPANTPTGTRVRTTLPADAELYNAEGFAGRVANYSSSLPGSFTVYSSYGRDHISEQSTPATRAQVFANLTTRILTVPGATVALKLSPETLDVRALTLRTLNNGVYQLDSYASTAAPGEILGPKLPLPASAIADIRATVPEGDPLYPFTANREQLREDFTKALREAVYFEIIQPIRQQSSDVLKRSYDNVPTVKIGDKDVPIYDVGKRLTQAELDGVMQKPGVERVVTEMLTVLDRVLARVLGDNRQHIERVGVLLDENVHGVFISNPRTAGNRKASIFINPFQHLVPHATPDTGGAGTYHTIVHEAVHWFVSGHDEKFTSKLGAVITELGARFEVAALGRMMDAYADRHDADRLDPDVLDALSLYSASRGRPVVEIDALSGTGSHSRRRPDEPGEQGPDIRRPGRGRSGTPHTVTLAELRALATRKGTTLEAQRARATQAGYTLADGTTSETASDLASETPAGVASAIHEPIRKGRAVGPMRGRVGAVEAIELPEMVALARELTGMTPTIMHHFRSMKRGDFSGGRIRALASLFKTGQERQIAATLAHEFGHLLDWLPHKTLKRGNLLGRLLSLQGFLKGTFITDDGVTIKNKDVTAELKKLSKAWRPWNPETAPASEARYRNSAKELFADAVSVLFNNPGKLEEEAPIFYRTFFQELDRKPDVAAAYFELLEQMAGTREDLIARRRARLRDGFRDGTMKALTLQQRRQAMAREEYHNLGMKLRHLFVDKYAPIADLVADAKRNGVTIPEDENPIYLLNEFHYVGGRQRAFLGAEIEPIYRRLTDAGVMWEGDFGEALFNSRVLAGDRSDLANPHGLQPAAVQELQDSLEAELGQEKWAVVAQAMTDLRDIAKKLSAEAYQEGLFSDELHRTIQENPAYAPFRVIEYMDDNVNWRVKSQKGTLKAVANPADTFVLKMLSTIRAIERNKTTRSVTDFLAQHFPAEIESAKTRWTGRGHEPLEPRDRRQGLVTFYRDGHRVGYVVDRYIADAVNNKSIGHNRALMTVLNLVTGAPVFRPLFTTFNPGFSGFNLIRDFRRLWRNTPGLTMRRALALYKGAWPVAKMRAYGPGKHYQPGKNKAVDEAHAKLLALESAQILNVTYNDLAVGSDTPTESYIESVFAQSGLRDFEEAPRRALVLRPIVAVLDVIREAGDLIETLPKVAAADYFRGGRPVSELTAGQRDFIRRMAGSPDFLSGGTLTAGTNKLFLYSNAAAQGIRSDYQIARHPGAAHMPPVPVEGGAGGAGTPPPSQPQGGIGGENWEHRASGFWWKTASTVLLPRIVMYLALLGAFGETVRRILQRGSTEYDRTNYIVVPLGEDGPNGVVLRIPDDETNRLLGGLFWKLLEGAHGDKDVLATLQQVLSLTGGQLPSMAPLLEAAPKVGQMVTDQNPYDFFRGRNVLTDQEAQAGGWQAWRKFIGYEFQELGGGIVWKFYAGTERPRVKTPGQLVLDLPIVSNVVGRFIKSTNYGETERLRGAQAEAQKTEAQTSLAMRAALDDAIRAFQGLPAGQRTTAKAQALAMGAVISVYGKDQPESERQEKYKAALTKLRMGLLRGSADPATDAVLSASSTAQKVAVILEAADGMSEAEFQTWLQRAQAEGVVTNDIVLKVLRAHRSALAIEAGR